MLIGLVSAKGSPGVTTAALALAAVAGRRRADDRDGSVGRQHRVLDRRVRRTRTGPGGERVAPIVRQLKWSRTPPRLDARRVSRRCSPRRAAPLAESTIAAIGERLSIVYG